MSINLKDIPDLMADTGDSIGWFTYQKSDNPEQRAQENEAENRTASFFSGMLGTLIDLEGKVGDFPSERQNDLEHLQELTEELQELLYLPVEERGKQNAQRKTQSRFEIDSLITLYTPDNRSTDGKKITPASKYNFQTPAVVDYSITDHQTNQLLVLSFFPQQYAFFHRRPQLAGSDIPLARDSMAIRDRNIEEVHQTLSRAEQSLVKPYFAISLSKIDSETGIPKLSTSVRGEWGDQKVRTNTGEKNMY